MFSPSLAKRVWDAVGREGSFAAMTLHDAQESDAMSRAPVMRIVRLRDQDDIAQVCQSGLFFDGEQDGRDTGFAASFAQIFTLSSKGRERPSEADLSLTFRPGLVFFGHVVRVGHTLVIGERRGVLFDNGKGDTDRFWACLTRSTCTFHLTAQDIVVAAAPFRCHSFEGKQIYANGKVSPEWEEALPSLLKIRAPSSYVAVCAYD